MRQQSFVTQTVTMEKEARQELRETALEHDLSGGPFARVLVAAALEQMKVDPAFREHIAAETKAEKQRYKKGA